MNQNIFVIDKIRRGIQKTLNYLRKKSENPLIKDQYGRRND